MTIVRTSTKFALAAICTSIAVAAQITLAVDPAPTAAAGAAVAPAAGGPTLSTDMQRKMDGLPKDLVTRMNEEMPTAPIVKPKKERKLLVYMESKGYYHDSIPMGGLALKVMGDKTGAWKATLTDDESVWTAETLAKYDCVFMDNTVGEHPKTAEGKKALLDYVKAGHGFGGTHAGADCNHNWDDYATLLGGEFAGHPWGPISVKNEDPKSPINAMFGGKGFLISDEIYTFKMSTDKRKGYNRDTQHVLLSVDMENSHYKDTTRKDGDYALSWIHTYGEGRVFYTALSHSQRDFSNGPILNHHMAGIQYTLGDLEADATPSAKLTKPTIVPGPDRESKDAKDNIYNVK